MSSAEQAKNESNGARSCSPRSLLVATAILLSGCELAEDPEAAYHRGVEDGMQSQDAIAETILSREAIEYGYATRDEYGQLVWANCELSVLYDD